jgi:signal transduction histidine kinase
VPSAFSSVPLYLVYTIALSGAIAVALTAFGTHTHGFGQNLVYSQCIGLITYASIDLPRRMLWPRGAPPLAAMLGLAVVAAPVAWFGGSYVACILLGEPRRPTALGLDTILGFLALTAGAGIAGTFFFWTRERIAESERGAAEARLKLLQAQVEPHFLFNTLANLQALITVDPKRALAMLGHLDGYLRATLATTRSDRGTLAAEFALLRGYLEILAIRMGPRLAYELDLPAALADTALPPMLLQPLVENAIRHGLEPKVEGGSIRVSARSEGATLVLVVEDSGLGLGQDSGSAGTGLGLGNVRERLAAVYGGKAAMDIGAAPGGGVRVTLRLPPKA